MSPEYRATLRKSQVLSRNNVRNRQPLRLVSLLLAILTICLSISIIGTAGHTYSTFRTQQAANNPWWLPLWPGHFDTAGTKSLIGAGIGVFLMNAIFVVLCLVPKLNFHAESLRAMMTAVVLSTASSLLSVVAVVISAVLNGRKETRDTIQTWTCRWDSGIRFPAVVIDNEPTLSNSKFGLLCTESKYAFWTTVVVIVLQAALFVVAITQWVMMMWRRYEREVERPDSGNTELTSTKISEEFPKQQY